MCGLSGVVSLTCKPLLPFLQRHLNFLHHLGGSMAASYLASHTEDFDGLILLGSYSTADLSGSGLAVLSVYGIGAFPPSKDSYTVCVGITGYNKNPFLYSEFADFAITFSHGGNTEYGGYADGVYQISGMTYGESLTLHFDHYGTSFDLDIPIPWEEVPQ